MLAAVPRASLATAARRFRRSINTREPVLTEFLAPVPGHAGALARRHPDRHRVGLPAGIIAAVRRGIGPRSRRDGGGAHRLLDADLLVGPAADHPVFRHPRWTPVSGRIALLLLRAGHRLHADRLLLVGPAGRLSSALSHLVLPAIVLGTIPLAVIARQTRSAMLEVLGEDYVRTARAKGLPPRRVIGTACAAQRPDPGRHHDRPPGRHADRRRRPDRDHLLLARRRQLAGQFDRPARLSLVQGGILLISAAVILVNLARPDLQLSTRGSARALSPTPPSAPAPRPPPARWSNSGATSRENRAPWSASRCSSLSLLAAVFAPCGAPLPTSSSATLSQAAAGLAGGRPWFPARHRCARPRHALAHHLRRALLVADRPRRRHLALGRRRARAARRLRAAWVDSAIMRVMDILLALPACCSPSSSSRCWARA